MKTIMQKHSIIELKKERKSNREVARLLNTDRKTVAKYWNEYLKNMKDLLIAEDELIIKGLQ